MKKIYFDASLCNNNLHVEKIVHKDLAIFKQFEIKDWNGQNFDDILLVKYGKWVINEDKSIIFKAIGGGACEIPEMYTLIYQREKIRVECGGGGPPGIRVINQDQVTDILINITKIFIPQKLLHETDDILNLIAEAFAVHLSINNSTVNRLIVDFNME